MGSYVSILKELGCINERSYCLAMYLVELCSLEYQYLKFAPSLVAASAVHLSRKQKPWTADLERITGYGKRDLLPCLRFVARVHQLACEETAPDAPLTPLKEKYRMHSMLCVSSEKPLKATITTTQ